MHCTNCQTALQPGATVCPVCGTPISDGLAQPHAPSYYRHGDEPAVQDPYGYTPLPPPTSNYSQGQSAGTDAMNTVPTGLPLPNYSYPQGQLQTGYVRGSVPGVADSQGVLPAQPPKRRRRVGLIVGVVTGVLLLCVGLIALGAVISGRLGGTGQANAPSGKSIVSSASTILHNPHTSTEIDQDYNPTHVTSTFKVQQLVYLTFDIDSGDKDGYIQAKWYANGQIVNVSVFSHTHANNAGLFTLAYTIPTTTGAVELYWCTRADCSDAQLAQVLHFTITNTSFVPGNNTDIVRVNRVPTDVVRANRVYMDINRAPTDAHKGLPYYTRRV